MTLLNPSARVVRIVLPAPPGVTVTAAGKADSVKEPWDASTSSSTHPVSEPLLPMASFLYSQRSVCGPMARG